MKILTDNGARVITLPKDESLSLDALYCRDSSIVTDQGIILCNMGKAARKKEPEAIRKFLSEGKLPILGAIEAPGTLEGGDLAWLDQNTLAVGLGYRTNKEGIRQLKQLLKPFEIEVLELQAKKKLSQNKSEVEQRNIIDALSKSDHTNEKLIAN